MKLLVCMCAVLLSSTQLPPKVGKIQSVHEPKADFARFATYTWERGREAFDPSAHKAIIEAVDVEMAARGFKRLASGAGDVTIRYHTTTRTDVILDKLDELQQQGKPGVTKNMGRLVIEMRDASNRRVWAADTVQPLDTEATKVYEQIPPIVARLFETYPKPKK